VVAIAYLCWISDLNTELDSYWIDITDNVGSVTFTDLNRKRAYIAELYVRDSSWNSRYDNREGYPNGAGDPEFWWKFLVGKKPFPAPCRPQTRTGFSG